MLAAVMLLQPVAASAVTWSTVLESLAQSGTYSGDGLNVTTEDDSVTIEGDNGTLEDFYYDGSYTTYTFVGTMEINGESFSVFVANTSDEESDDASEATTVYVNIGEGVVINAENVLVEAGDSNTIYLTNDGYIESVYDEDDEEGDYTGSVTLSSWGSGVLVVDNNGTIVSATELSIDSHGVNTSTTLTNDGIISSGSWISISAGEYDESDSYDESIQYSSTVTVTNNGDIILEGENGLSLNGFVGGTLVFENNGTVDASEVGHDAFCMDANNDSSITLENNGEIDLGSGDMSVNAHDSATMTFENSGTLYGGERIGLGADDNASTTIVNTESGTIVGTIDGGGNGISATVTNEGSISGNIQVYVEGNTVANVTNSGTVDNIYTGTYSEEGDSSSLTVDNSGTVNGELCVEAGGNSEAAVSNSGTVTGETWFNATGDSSMTVENNGTFENGLAGAANDNSTLIIENNGTVTGGEIFAGAYGNGSAEVSNTETGTADKIWVSVYDGATATSTNDGIVIGEFGGEGVGEGSSFTLENNNTAGSSWVNSYDGADVISTNNGTISGETGVQISGDTSLTITNGENATSGDVVVYVSTGSDEVLSSETVAQIIANVNLPADTIVKTMNENWEETATYEIDENGNVIEKVEEEKKKEESGDNGPSPEMIRHWMEELRKEQAIGGVYGSPYWLKQLYLGYHSLELRVFENGERVLFKEILSWKDGGPEKRLTLRARVEDPENLTIQLDGEVIDILERCEFTVITLTDVNKNVYMEYSVADLKAAREMYGLARTDLLCVGAADAEVMKIGADGVMVPVEQDTSK